MFMRGWSPAGSVPNSLVGTPAIGDKKSEPPATDEEMQAKIQYMITLQKAAQDQSFPDLNDSPQQAPRPPPPLETDSVAGAYITPMAAAEAKAAAAATGKSAAVADATGTGDLLAVLNANVQQSGLPPAALPPPPPPSTQQEQQQKGRSIMGSYQDYAATSGYAREVPGSSDNNTEGVGQGHMYFSHEYNEQSEEQQPMLDGTVPLYGGTMVVDHAVIDSEIDDPDYVEPKQHHHHRRHCFCCSCWMQCISYWKNAEALHRSFCYGSIDGMLTGSGIVATFLGMGLLTSRASTAMHVFVVAFSLAACTSDAICMALGHVWSTYVLTNASANERRTERLSFEQNRADAKGKLVDMLLSRGMLKIDAMSIADTLEGYPDIFVSALVGDSGYALGEESLPSSLSSSGHFGLGYQQGASPEDPPFSPLLRAARRSFGQFNDYELDPEATSVKLALGESRKEGFVMMLSFALFSVLPSLIFLWLSTVMNVSVKHRASGGTSVTSIAVSLTSFIMLLLGIWKSTFSDSHWVWFGIETVVVLWMCTLSAYFIGFGLSVGIPGLHGIIKDNEL